MNVLVEIKVTNGEQILFEHSEEFENIYKKDGSIHKTNEKRMLSRLRKLREHLDETYPAHKFSQRKADWEFSQKKND